MSIKETWESLKNIDTWNKSPWDKVSHTVIGLLFAAPIFYVTNGDVGTATTAAAFMLYGREQAQAVKKVGEIKSWFPWAWTKDGIQDVVIPVAIIAPVLYGVGQLGVL
jgi:hypothetical protein